MFGTELLFLFQGERNYCRDLYMMDKGFQINGLISYHVVEMKKRTMPDWLTPRPQKHASCKYMNIFQTYKNTVLVKKQIINIIVCIVNKDRTYYLGECGGSRSD